MSKQFQITAINSSLLDLGLGVGWWVDKPIFRVVGGSPLSPPTRGNPAHYQFHKDWVITSKHMNLLLKGRTLIQLKYTSSQPIPLNLNLLETML